MPKKDFQGEVISELRPKMEEPETKTGGSGGGTVDAAIIEKAANGYILRLMIGEGEEVRVYSDDERSKLFKDLASYL